MKGCLILAAAGAAVFALLFGAMFFIVGQGREADERRTEFVEVKVISVEPGSRRVGTKSSRASQRNYLDYDVLFDVQGQWYRGAFRLDADSLRGACYDPDDPTDFSLTDETPCGEQSLTGSSRSSAEPVGSGDVRDYR